MHLKIRSRLKIVSPCSLVDSVFTPQGFKKMTRKNSPCYHLRLTDNITNVSYRVEIPLQEIYFNNKGNKEPLYKLQEFIIYPVSQGIKNHYIPKEVIDAVKEKVSEVFSYLDSEILAVKR